ncbi:hypothetical protein C8Q77DRAFT_920595 [Trametes polyzona]|nr:hypothetical protein C8Q77DRAFT_920595 [Trametes polyzona]
MTTRSSSYNRSVLDAVPAVLCDMYHIMCISPVCTSPGPCGTPGDTFERAALLVRTRYSTRVSEAAPELRAS